MKVTVNLTPQGLIIYVPKWMSFDLGRDLVIKEITKLQKARGVLRQGPKISESRLDKEELAKAVYLANEAARKAGRKGEKRREFIIEETGLSPRTDMRRIRELIRQGEALVNAEKTEVPAAITSKIETPLTEPDRLQRVRAAITHLSPEEKKEVMKMLAA